jgi:DNA processing protein
MSTGCHWLIKQGAKLVENVADILSELNNYSDNIGLNYKREKKKALDTKKSGDSHLLIDPLLASVDYETTPVDKVVSRSKLPIEEVLTRLTVLELRGLVTAVPGGYLKLNGG